jgi:hypothetical protein
MMMSKKIGFAVVLCCLAILGATTAYGQEVEEAAAPAAPTIRPIEIFTCSFNEGQTMDDLMQVTAGWNAWMDGQEQANYWAYLLVPVYHSSEIEFDVAWVGGWPDGAQMAAGTEYWISNGGEHNAAFQKVVDCAYHANFGVFDVQQNPTPFSSGPVEFSDCTVKEGKTSLDAIGAINQWVAYLAEQELVAGQYLLFPAFGESSEAEYDFKWVTSSSWESFGRAYDQFGTGGGWRKSQELFGELMDCDSPRVYQRMPVRKLDLPE